MRKGIVAAGIGLFVLVAAVAAYMYSRGLPGVVLDSAKVEAMARAMLPGAAPPPGSKGVLGLELEKAEVAVFAPSLDKASADALQGSDLRIVIAAVGSADEKQSMDEVRAALEQQKARKQARLTQQGQSVVRLEAGGSPHRARRTVYTVVDGGGTVLEYTLVFKPAQRPVVVQIMGPEATFDEAAMKGFLAALQVPAGPGERLPERAGEIRERAADARQKAEEARQKADEARQKADEARRKAEEARRKAEEAREGVQERAEQAREAADQARAKAEEARAKAEEARAAAEAAREKVQDAREGAAERLEDRRERRGR